MSAVTIRPARPEDARTVLELTRALARFIKAEDWFLATLADVERDCFGAAPRYEAWLAEVKGAPAGLATLFPTYSTFKAKPCLFVDSLYVDETARGHGVGKVLMRHICRLAVERDCVRVDLNVLNWNPARNFYAGLGMQETGELGMSITGPAMRTLAGLDQPVT